MGIQVYQAEEREKGRNPEAQRPQAWFYRWAHAWEAAQWNPAPTGPLVGRVGLGAGPLRGPALGWNAAQWKDNELSMKLWVPSLVPRTKKRKQWNQR
jgi:hypothetical protein